MTQTVKPTCHVGLMVGIALIIFIAVLNVANRDLGLPEPKAADSTEFSALRAVERLKQLNPEAVPHPGNTANNTKVGDAIIEQLTALGYQPEIQQVDVCKDFQRGVAQCMKVRNILVHLPGKPEAGNILLSAHYDSVAAGPGAADAGVAVGTLLDVAYLLTTRDNGDVGVVLLFNEGEEDGLFGAKAFIDKHPLAKDIKLAMNIEARGTSGYSVLFETGHKSGQLVEAYADVMSPIWANSVFAEAYRFMPNYTDFNEFHKLEIKGLNFANGETEPHYHTPLDNFENLSLHTLQHHGDNVWRFVDHLIERNSLEFTPENRVFTDVMGWLLVSWSASITLIIVGVIGVMWLAATVLAKRSSQITLKGVLGAALLTLLVVVLSAVMAQALQMIVQMLKGAAPWHASNVAMSMTVWFGCGWVVLGLGRLLGNKLSSLDFFLGLMLLMVLLAAATGVLLPGVSYLFVLPSVILLPILLVNLLVRKAQRVGQHKVLLWLAPVVFTTFFYAIVQVAEIMFNYNMSAVQGLMWGFIFASALPLMPVKAVPLKGALSLFIGFCVLFLVATFIQKPFTESRPQGLNLQYMEIDENAYTIVGVPRKKLSRELREALPELEVMQPFPWDRQRFRTQVSRAEGIVPNAAVQPQISHDQLHLAFDVEDAHRLLTLSVYISDNAKLSQLQSFGETHQYADEKSARNGYYDYTCYGQTCANMVLTGEGTDLDQATIFVAAKYMGLPPEKHELMQQRGKRSVPRNGGDVTVSVKTLQTGVSTAEQGQ